MNRKKHFRSKRRKIYYRVISLVISILLVSSTIGFAGQGSYNKNETVYIMLDESGKVLDERVVNSFHGEVQGDSIVDYGEYSSVKNMKTKDKPEISGDQIKWSKKSFVNGSLYYEGVTDKESPVDIDIEYFLDGKKISVHDLVGKDGLVKISIKLKNKLEVDQDTTYTNHNKELVSKKDEYYIPLLVQISYPADLTIFSDISAEDGINVVTGETMSLNFAAFPYPEEEVTFEMMGKEIEINPITITVIPKLPMTPDIDMDEDIQEMLDGIIEIRKGVDELRKGSNSIVEGSREIDSRSKEFLDGGTELVNGLEQLNENSLAINSGLNDSIEGFKELKSGTENMAGGLEHLSSGIEALSSSTAELSGGVGALKEGAGNLKVAGNQIAEGVSKLDEINSQIENVAKKLMAQNLPGSDLYNLGMSILTQSEILTLLAPGSSELDYGIQGLEQGISSLKDNLDTKFIPGIQEIAVATRELAGGSKQLLAGMEEYNAGQTELNQGIEKYSEGVKEASKGISALSNGGAEMFSGLKELFSYQEKITKGLNSLKTEGISKMEKGLIEAVDEIAQGKVKKDNIVKLGDSYKSFMNNEKNTNSSVQFVMQTKKVGIEEVKDEKVQVVEKDNLWTRLMKLFGIK